MLVVDGLVRAVLGPSSESLLEFVEGDTEPSRGTDCKRCGRDSADEPEGSSVLLIDLGLEEAEAVEVCGRLQLVREVKKVGCHKGGWLEPV